MPTLKAFLKVLSQNVSGNKQKLVAHAIGCPKMHFYTNSRSSEQPRSDAKTLFFHPPPSFPVNFLQLQQCWHLYCVTILGSTSIVIHAYSEISPEVTLRPLATFCAKDCKWHSLVQTSFTELPNRHVFPGPPTHASDLFAVGRWYSDGLQLITNLYLCRWTGSISGVLYLCLVSSLCLYYQVLNLCRWPVCC